MKQKLDILVVGGGGREHAIVRKLRESPRCRRVFCTPGNGGIARDAVCYDVTATDVDGVVALAKECEADLVFVAPDDPLVAGMVDALEDAGIPAFGPRANAAILEGSKVFSKNLMKKYGIPTARYEVFEDPAEALRYIRQQDRYPAVVKADGLALGKGVLLCANYEEARKAVHDIMEDRVFGASEREWWWRNSSPDPRYRCWLLPMAKRFARWSPQRITNGCLMEIWAPIPAGWGRSVPILFIPKIRPIGVWSIFLNPPLQP